MRNRVWVLFSDINSLVRDRERLRSHGGRNAPAPDPTKNKSDATDFWEMLLKLDLASTKRGKSLSKSHSSFADVQIVEPGILPTRASSDRPDTRSHSEARCWCNCDFTTAQWATRGSGQPLEYAQSMFVGIRAHARSSRRPRLTGIKIFYYCHHLFTLSGVEGIKISLRYSVISMYSFWGYGTYGSVPISAHNLQSWLRAGRI